MLAEVAENQPSQETTDLTGKIAFTDDELRERMSGNICRCSAYPQIVAAIKSYAGGAA
jgi:xanthine dehydrogenase YagT iron-sulfur-binding subunit